MEGKKTSGFLIAAKTGNGLPVALLFIFMLFACAAVGVRAFVPEHELAAGFLGIWNTFRSSVTVAIISLASAIVLAALGGLAWLAQQGWETGWIKYLQRRLLGAEVQLKEREANFVVTVAAPGSQVYVHRVEDFPVTTDPIYLSPGRVNGAITQPTPEDERRYYYYHLAQSISKKPESAAEQPLALAAALPEHVDLAHYVQSPSMRSIFLGVGRFPDGQVRPVWAPWSRLVMVAIGGATGFGKSFFVQSLAWQLLNSRERTKVILLDAKGASFSAFAGHENLRWGVATNETDIENVLGWTYEEVMRRQGLFNRWQGVQDIDTYNQAVRSEEDRLPYVPLLFEEFGLVAENKSISRYAKKIAQIGRNAGINAAFSAQSWLSDEISSAIKVNLSTAVQFYVNKSQSRILLGDSAAAEITRRGEARLLLPGQPGLVALQGPDPSGLVACEPVLLDGDDWLAAARQLPPRKESESELQDRTFVELVRSGVSRNEAAMRAYDKPYSGSLVARCKKLLGEFGTPSSSPEGRFLGGLEEEGE